MPGNELMRILADTEKHYMCYFCEEEIEFSLSRIADNLSTPNWRHTATGKEVCETRATPSNVEV